MRNLFIAILCLFALATNAQSVTPRTGNATNTDNTYRVLNYKFYSVTDGTANDTTTIIPKHYHTEISVPSLTDSINIKVANIANSYYGDELCVRIINTSTGTKVKFIGGTFEVGSGTSVITLTASKRANIKFVFDGNKWVEVSRLVQ